MFEGSCLGGSAERKAARPRTAPNRPPKQSPGTGRAADDWALGTGHPYSRNDGERPDWQIRSMPNNRLMEAARQEAWAEGPSDLLPGPNSGWKAGAATRQSAPLTPNRMRAHVQAMIRKSPEDLAMELIGAKKALHSANNEIRKLGTENGRLSGQLRVAQQNVLKAEELLNNKERELSPTQGLSQMYRSPDTTALVGRLKEHATLLIVERDKLLAESEAGKKEKRATRLSELQSQVACLTDELKRQKNTNDVLKEQLLDAQAMADNAAKQTQEAMVTLKQYLRTGEGVPMPPPKIAPTGSLSAAKFGATLASLRKAHTAMLSQAQLIKALFPKHGMSMEQLDKAAIQRTSTVGTGDVLRCLRVHLKRLAIELHGLPGGYQGVDDETGLHAPAGLQDPNVSFKHALAEHVRKLRTFTPDMFTDDVRLQVELQDVWDLVAEIQQEACRLVGHWHHHTPVKGAPEVDAQPNNNPLYSVEPEPCWDPASQFGDGSSVEREFVGTEASEGGQSSAVPLSAVEEEEEEDQEDDQEDSPGRLVQVCDLVSSLAKYQADHAITLDALVERFDINGDGRLQPNELRAFVTALLGKTPEKEHRYLQAMLDNDGDGNISVAEIRLVVRHAADLRTSCISTDKPTGTQIAVDSCARAIAEQQSRAKRLFTAVQVDGTCSYQMLTLPHLRTFFSHLCPDMKSRDMRCVLAYLHYKDVHEDLFSWDILCQALQVDQFLHCSSGDEEEDAVPPKPALDSVTSEASSVKGGRTHTDRSIPVASVHEPEAAETSRTHSYAYTQSVASAPAADASRATSRTTSAVSRALSDDVYVQGSPAGSRALSAQVSGKNSLSSRLSSQQPSQPVIPEQPQATYCIKVETGTAPGSASSAHRALVTLVGEGGRSTELVLPRLDSSAAGKARFGRGAVDTFESIKACDVGELSALIVRLEDTQDSSPAVSWQLDSVSVSKAGAPRTWVFDFANWIGSKYGFSHRLSLSYTTGGEQEDEAVVQEGSTASSIHSAAARSAALGGKSMASSVVEEASMASTAVSEHPSEPSAKSLSEQPSSASVASSEASKVSASSKSLTSKASGSAVSRRSKSRADSVVSSKSAASSGSKAASASVTSKASSAASPSAASQSAKSQTSAASELTHQQSEASQATAASEAASKVSSRVSSMSALEQRVRGLSSQSSRSRTSKASSAAQEQSASASLSQELSQAEGEQPSGASGSLSQQASQAASEAVSQAASEAASQAASEAASQAASEAASQAASKQSNEMASEAHSEAASEAASAQASHEASEQLKTSGSLSQEPSQAASEQAGASGSLSRQPSQAASETSQGAKSAASSHRLGSVASQSRRSLAASQAGSVKSSKSLAFLILEQTATPGGSQADDQVSRSASSRPRSAASDAQASGSQLHSRSSSKVLSGHSRQASIKSARSNQLAAADADGDAPDEDVASFAQSEAQGSADGAANSAAGGDALDDPVAKVDAEGSEAAASNAKSAEEGTAEQNDASESGDIAAEDQQDGEPEEDPAGKSDELEDSNEVGSQADADADADADAVDEEGEEDADADDAGGEITSYDEESPASSPYESQESPEESAETSQEESAETSQEESAETSQEESAETSQEESAETSQEESAETSQEESAETSQEEAAETSQEESAETSQETSGSPEETSGSAEEGTPETSGDVSQETGDSEEPASGSTEEASGTAEESPEASGDVDVADAGKATSAAGSEEA